MRVAVTFCCWSGAALDCAVGATSVSEQALACEILLRAAGRCLFVGDRNFGVFRIVQTARQAKKPVLLRMTDARAAKLLGRALEAGDFPVAWQPSRHDQLQPQCDIIRPGRLIITVWPGRLSPAMALPLHHPGRSAGLSALELGELYGGAGTSNWICATSKHRWRRATGGLFRRHGAQAMAGLPARL